MGGGGRQTKGQKKNGGFLETPPKKVNTFWGFLKHRKFVNFFLLQKVPKNAFWQIFGQVWTAKFLRHFPGQKPAKPPKSSPSGGGVVGYRRVVWVILSPIRCIHTKKNTCCHLDKQLLSLCRGMAKVACLAMDQCDGTVGVGLTSGTAAKRLRLPTGR